MQYGAGRSVAADFWAKVSQHEPQIRRNTHLLYYLHHSLLVHYLVVYFCHICWWCVHAFRALMLCIRQHCPAKSGCSHSCFLDSLYYNSKVAACCPLGWNTFTVTGGMLLWSWTAGQLMFLTFPSCTRQHAIPSLEHCCFPEHPACKKNCPDIIFHGVDREVCSSWPATAASGLTCSESENRSA